MTNPTNYQDFKKTNANSDGLINCLLQPGLLFNQPIKSLRANSFQLIKFCCTRTEPAAETKSIGLQANAQLSWFLQHHLDNFIVMGQLPFVYQDSAVKTIASGQENFRPPTGTGKNTCNPDTDANSNKPPGRYSAFGARD